MPALQVAAVLNQIYEASAASDTISQPQIRAAASYVCDTCRHVLKALWDDCSPDMQADLVAIQERVVPRNELTQDRQDEHDVRGFAAIAGGLLTVRSQMMGVFAKRQQAGLPEVKRLFADEERFRDNARALLEVRRDQVIKIRMAQMDSSLVNLVQSAVTQVRDPAMTINVARMIRNRALEMIWAKECPTGQIPPAWITAFGALWSGTTIPAPSGNAIRLLQLATGFDRIQRMTTHITKRTYVLLSFVHAVGDHGQHAVSTELTWSYGVTYCLAAIELMESLAIDMP